MFLAIFISGSYEFCSDGKGSLYTLYVGYFKRPGSSHTRCIKRQACFDKNVNENRWKVSSYTSSVWSLARQEKSILKKIMKASQQKGYNFSSYYLLIYYILWLCLKI